MFLPPDQFVGWKLDDAITAERCAALVDMLGTRGFEATGVRYPDDYRNNDRLVFDDAELAAWLFREVGARLPAELLIDGERWTLMGLNRRFRACRYASGQSFCIHRDGPYAPDADMRSHLTLQLYLDDDPARDGGRTRFYADPRGETLWAAIAPRRGSAIVFDHRAWHDGEAVTGGIKHVLRTDVMYRRVAVTPADGADDPRVLYRHRGYAWQAIVCRDGTIASAGRDGFVRRWSDRVTATIDLGAGSVTRVLEASDGRLWCGTRAGTVFVVEGLRSMAIAAEGAAILGLAARPDGGVIAATGHGELVAFERNGACAWRRRVHDGWAWAVVADGGRYVSCGHAGQLVAVDDDGGSVTELARIDGASLRALAIAGDEIVVGDTHGTVHRLGRDGSTRGSWSAHRSAITGIAVLRDGRIVSGGEDGAVRVWSGVELAATFTAGDFVTSVAEEREGDLVTASYDGAIYRLR